MTVRSIAKLLHICWVPGTWTLLHFPALGETSHSDVNHRVEGLLKGCDEHACYQVCRLIRFNLAVLFLDSAGVLKFQLWLTKWACAFSQRYTIWKCKSSNSQYIMVMVQCHTVTIMLAMGIVHHKLFWHCSASLHCELIHTRAPSSTPRYHSVTVHVRTLAERSLTSDVLSAGPLRYGMQSRGHMPWQVPDWGLHDFEFDSPCHNLSMMMRARMAWLHARWPCVGPPPGSTFTNARGAGALY